MFQKSKIKRLKNIHFETQKVLPNLSVTELKKKTDITKQNREWFISKFVRRNKPLIMRVKFLWALTFFKANMGFGELVAEHSTFGAKREKRSVGGRGRERM